MKKLTLVLALLMFSSPAWGNEGMGSLEYAKLGKKLFSVFECSHYAISSKNEMETRRLWELALKTGRIFVDAFRAGKITENDWKKNVPVVWGMLGKGPSTDFILGKYWQYMSDDIYEKMERDLSAGGCKECKWDKDLRAMHMVKLFEDSNCALIK